MKYKLLLTKKAKKDLSSLEKNIQKRIAKKLRFYISDNTPLKHAKKLRNSRLGEYRFKIGDYRAIFDVDKDGNIILLLILRIKHRKNVYL
ncbi:MAG: type II toxin-antitoxin system RelE/ParE family toxin [Candidatus Pacebacteria bacterium]|nr:type II toxin-antitoxin system RelE/ParE family toxin [Candidatus Paceibacterota bacterium]